MAQDDDWGDVESVPEKSQVPKLLFCGLGCFLPILLMIVVFTWIGSSIRRGTDTTRQWAELQARLPHSERPEDWRLVFGFQPGGISWLLTEEVFVFTSAPEGESMEKGSLIFLIWTDDDLAEMFDTRLEGVSPYTVPPAPHDAPEVAASEEGGAESDPESDPGPETEAPPEPVVLETLDVGGRARPIVLLSGESGGSAWFSFGTEDPEAAGPAVAIDLSPEAGALHLVLLAQSNTEQPMDLETLRGFLDAFDFEAASDARGGAGAAGEGR